MITPEMNEIIDYLSTRDNYAIFAGFAAFLQTGVDASADIDVFIATSEEIEQMSQEFQQKGWTEPERKIVQDKVVKATVEKNETTFDLIFSVNAQAYIDTCEKVECEGKQLSVLSKEALLVTKMLQLTQNRPDSKTQRDRQVIADMRPKIDPMKLKQLLSSLDNTFWTKGYF